MWSCLVCFLEVLWNRLVTRNYNFSPWIKRGFQIRTGRMREKYANLWLLKFENVTMIIVWTVFTGINDSTNVFNNHLIERWIFIVFRLIYSLVRYAYIRSIINWKKYFYFKDFFEKYIVYDWFVSWSSKIIC